MQVVEKSQTLNLVNKMVYQRLVVGENTNRKFEYNCNKEKKKETSVLRNHHRQMRLGNKVLKRQKQQFKHVILSFQTLQKKSGVFRGQ